MFREPSALEPILNSQPAHHGFVRDISGTLRLKENNSANPKSPEAQIASGVRPRGFRV